MTLIIYIFITKKGSFSVLSLLFGVIQTIINDQKFQYLFAFVFYRLIVYSGIINTFKVIKDHTTHNYLILVYEVIDIKMVPFTMLRLFVK